MKFDLDEAVKIADRAVSVKANRSLTDVEAIVLKGAWHRLDYDQIAAQHQYATSYISQDVAPKLWKLLSDALGEKVKKSNFKQVLERHWQQQSTLSNRQVSPSVAIAPPTPESAVPDSYVEQPAIASICYETLLQPGALVRIKAPKLMGKTLLVTRILAQLATQGYRTVNLSFELADRKTHFTNLDKFLRWFCINLSRELGLPNELDEYWDEEGMGSKVSCTTYVEDYLLTSANSPLVLCLDDVDLLFPYPEIYEDFFGLLRSWYEKARSRQRWKALRLAIVHATDVYIRLNINQSPFNVGLPIELSEFTREQVQAFAKQHGLEGETSLVEPLMALVGGHPYLLNRAFSQLKSHPAFTVERLLAEAPTEAGIYGNHLREHWLQLQANPELAVAFKNVVTSTHPVQLDPLQAYQLQSMGLIKLSGNEAQPRCNLYRQYFGKRLGDG